MNIRKSGYYWIKFKEHQVEYINEDGWSIGYYADDSYSDRKWVIVGFEQSIHENEIDEIIGDEVIKNGWI